MLLGMVLSMKCRVETATKVSWSSIRRAIDISRRRENSGSKAVDMSNRPHTTAH